jgi:lipopolysaccharide transport system permease protein
MYGLPALDVDPDARTIKVRFHLNGTAPEHVGYQIYDPESGVIILHGEWHTPDGDEIIVPVTLPPERGQYHIYVSPVEKRGWWFELGRPFILIVAAVESRRASVIDSRITTVRRLRRRNRMRAVHKAFTLPFTSLCRNRSLIRSLLRRDIQARYRGSFGDVLWAVLNPLLLMATYFFVFGVVLESRFGPDNSRSGFVLYFLAGMLPWLAFSEAIGRAPHIVLEHRNFVKKLVFPVEILPVTPVAAGLVTQALATGIFLIALAAIRGYLPGSIVWLPALLIPQVLFTLGFAWFLAALGVYLRDLGQIIGFLLTLWFFLTPICYPEASLPPEAAAILTKNPVYVLVRGYRAIFLENHAPALGSLWKLSVLSFAVFIAGHAWFHKLRKSFADVI